jgi:hypothetical protein
MREKVSLQPGSQVEEQCQAGIEEYLKEMRRLEDVIAVDRRRIEASGARTAAIWAEIRGLREETRALLADLQGRA